VTRPDGAAGESEGVARAWGWVAHLRTGGTTPWARWRQAAPAARQAGRYLPGAQQLELVRRLNLMGTPTPELTDRVITASAPGRGLPDLALEGVLPPSRFGTPPVDPSRLGPGELVRVATALLAENVVAAGDPPEPRATRLLRRRYRVLGDPELARPIREALIADGRPPGGPSATVVVLGTGLDRMLAHVWTARSFGAGARPWREYLAAERRRADLSPRLDVAGLARTWADRVGTGRVHVVVDDVRLAARLAGRRRPAPALAELSADAVELARRTAPVVGALVTPERRSQLMWHRFRPVLAAYAGPPLLVPSTHHAWLTERTAHLRRRLSAGGYAVHGDLPGPSLRPGVPAPDEEAVLTLAMWVLLGSPAERPVDGTAQWGGAIVTGEDR
jgi:hypothetical protein